MCAKTGTFWAKIKRFPVVDSTPFIFEAKSGGLFLAQNAPTGGPRTCPVKKGDKGTKKGEINEQKYSSAKISLFRLISANPGFSRGRFPTKVHIFLRDYMLFEATIGVGVGRTRGNFLLERESSSKRGPVFGLVVVVVEVVVVVVVAWSSSGSRGVVQPVFQKIIFCH